jgi:hypothetical protein
MANYACEDKERALLSKGQISYYNALPCLYGTN